MTQDIQFKRLYKFELPDYYNSKAPVLYGMFIATEDEVDNAVARLIKICDRCEELTWNMIKEQGVSQLVIDALLEDVTDSTFTISGYNPLNYVI
jgi:hypothetical protein